MPVTVSQFQSFIENPPAEHARVAFLFRQAQGKRAQAETNVTAAEKGLEVARATLAEATGYQKALQDVITFEIERSNAELVLKAQNQTPPEPPALTPINGAPA
jgi:phosphoribosylaminoimidazole carboxylase (NCAIR synthetase)